MAYPNINITKSKNKISDSLNYKVNFEKQ